VNDFIKSALIIANALFTFGRDNNGTNHFGASLGLGAIAF
jgi:hypothetical protein